MRTNRMLRPPAAGWDSTGASTGQPNETDYSCAACDEDSYDDSFCEVGALTRQLWGERLLQVKNGQFRKGSSGYVTRSVIRSERPGYLLLDAWVFDVGSRIADWV